MAVAAAIFMAATATLSPPMRSHVQNGSSVREGGILILDVDHMSNDLPAPSPALNQKPNHPIHTPTNQTQLAAVTIPLIAMPELGTSVTKGLQRILGGACRGGGQS
jgi:hypothetical protein